MQDKETGAPLNAKKSPLQDRAYNFAVRRLIRYGSITKADIMDIVGCSPGTANCALALIRKNKDFVAQKGQKIILKPGVFMKAHLEWMAIASDQQLNQALEEGGHTELTGLKPREMPIQIKTWSSGRSLSPGLMSAIAQCLVHQHQFRKLDHRASLAIRYVGMRKGETARWRIIVPLGLDRVLDQWRLIAQDLGVKDYPVRTYVIPRIIEHKVVTDPLPKDFRLRPFDDSQSMMSITFNVELTRDQERVIRNEMNIDATATQIQVDRRSGLDFLRRFGAIPTNENALWPIITSLDNNKCL